MTTEIVPLPARGWTPQAQIRFLERLAHQGNARAAASAVGLSAQSAYRLRRRDALFARGWAAALLLARDTGAQVLAERAIDGVEEEVWHRGELMGTKRRFDTRLLLAHLGRLDRLADENAAGEDAARFDQLLACVAGEPVPEELAISDDALPPDRDEVGDIAVECAETEVADDWREKGVDPDALDEEKYRDFLVQRDQQSWRAWRDSTSLWDAWATRAIAAVDELIGDDDAPRPLPAPPGNPLAAAPDGAPGSSPGQCNPRKPSEPPAPEPEAVTPGPEGRRTH